MAKHLVLDMSGYKILGAYDDYDAAMAAAEGFPSPNHVLPADDWNSLPTQDIKKFYNSLPNVKPVDRFSDRAAALRRIVAAVNGEAPAQEPVNNTEDTPMLNVTAPSKNKRSITKAKASKAKVKVAAPRGKRSTAEDRKVAVSKEWKNTDPRFNKDSPRSHVFFEIRAKGETTVAALEKKFPDMTRGQILGAISKLRALDYVQFI